VFLIDIREPPVLIKRSYGSARLGTKHLLDNIGFTRPIASFIRTGIEGLSHGLNLMIHWFLLRRVLSCSLCEHLPSRPQ
jgi:hypothetical protein